jgi:hypothetical protein
MSRNVNKGQFAQKTQAPNVRLAHGQKPITTDGVVNIGGTPTMWLPSEEEQRKGFWVSHPTVFIHQYHPRYKFALNTESFATQGQPQFVVMPEEAGKAPEPETPEPDIIDRIDSLTESDAGYTGGETHAEKV